MTDSDADHVEKMKALQADQKQKRQESVAPDRGLVLIHTGNGKGKSSSAFGVLARALGWGHQAGVIQFIKGSWKTGEKQFFDKFPNQITWRTMGEGFTWNTQDRDRDIAAATRALTTSAEMLASGDFDLILLDEINIAIRYDYLKVSAVIAALQQRSKRTSVILTGRDAKPELIDLADLVTEMKEIKHPYHAGIMAQQGIDY
tara:strand:- start:19182 stop:19787 length:606 start_codon:yes stop_codon:yes gene_type:complete